MGYVGHSDGACVEQLFSLVSSGDVVLLLTCSLRAVVN